MIPTNVPLIDATMDKSGRIVGRCSTGTWVMLHDAWGYFADGWPYWSKDINHPNVVRFATEQEAVYIAYHLCKLKSVHCGILCGDGIENFLSVMQENELP